MSNLTIKAMFEENTKQFSELTAYQVKRDVPAISQGEPYVRYTFNDIRQLATGLISELKSSGIVKGDKVAILSENRPEWAISYMGIVSMGAIVVPLDSLGAETDLKGIILHSEAKAIIVSDKFIELARSMKGLKIISLDTDLENLRAKATNSIEGEVSPNDLAAIVYTSGTTGTPKGVMLTHGNLMTNLISTASRFEIGPTDSFLSVLPMHHTLETIGGILASFWMGGKVTYAESLKSFKLLQNMVEVKPTLFIGVPMMYQLFYDGIMREVEDKGIVVKLLVKILLAISKTVRFLFKVNIGRTLFSFIHKKFGGKFRFWISGGAAIDKQLLLNFDAMGFLIIQGYGLTESSPVITANCPGMNRFGAVGKPIDGVEVKIVDGEILAKGPNIMQGYYKMKEETDKVLKDGWLYTGDVGYQDKDGYLYITGRYKDVIIPGSGLNVYPDEIEFEINKSPYVKESCVIGRKIKLGVRKGSEEVFAVVIPDLDYFHRAGVSPEDSTVKIAMSDMIEHLNDRLPMYKRVSSFEIRPADFPKTSTRKIKRYAVKKEMEEIWQK